MKADNPLSQAFILHYPVEAARTLERVSPDDVAALFSELPIEHTIAVMVAMLPDRAAVSLNVMPAPQAAKLLSEIPMSPAARIYRLFPPEKQKQLAELFPDKVRMRMRRFLSYVSVSAGDLMDPAVTMLPFEISVADAIRRIEHLHHAVCCEIYIVDNTHHLLGFIELGKLMTSNHRARLRDVMNRKVQPISAHAMALTARSHPAWVTWRRLPVIERDNTLVGVLDYSRLQEACSEETITSEDSMDGLLSLATLYWMSLIRLLDCVFSMTRTDREERK